jgi:hypothetical protein
MVEVVELHADRQEGSMLCTVQLWRRADGSIQSVLSSMDGDLIETTGHDVPSRVAIVADWMLAGAADMDDQSRKWLEELQTPR